MLSIRVTLHTVQTLIVSITNKSVGYLLFCLCSVYGLCHSAHMSVYGTYLYSQFRIVSFSHSFNGVSIILRVLSEWFASYCAYSIYNNCHSEHTCIMSWSEYNNCHFPRIIRCKESVFLSILIVRRVPFRACVEEDKIQRVVDYKRYVTAPKARKMLLKWNLMKASDLKVHKHEHFFFFTFFAETETLWSQGPVTRDFWKS